MNNKGFMMAEVVVVSAVVLIFMASVYVSYNKVFSLYNTRINYYDSVTLYRLGYYRDLLIENEKMEEVMTSVKNNSDGVLNVNSDINNLKNEIGLDSDPVISGDTVYMFKNNKYELTSVANEKILSYFQKDSINPTLTDYVEFISTSVEFNTTNYAMILESCASTDDCKYAYLEVYDGNE